MCRPSLTVPALLLLAGSANALARAVNTDRQDIHQRQESPCAQLSNATPDGSSGAAIGNTSVKYVPAQLALSCLRTVPLQNKTNIRQLEGLRIFLQFQSDMSYLNSSRPARLYPEVDLIAGLETLEQRLKDSYYSNEYDFQSDIARLLASAYDGHLLYLPDILGSFIFARVSNGVPYSLISVSPDGTSLPSIYAGTDRMALARSGGASYEPSQITKINGRDVDDFLKDHAALTGSSQDPDANYNALFPNQFTLAGQFEAFLVLRGPAEETVLSFQNGTQKRLQLVAAPRIDLSGITDGGDFFERCCGGHAFPDDLPTQSSSPFRRAKRAVRGTPRTVLDDPRSRHLLIEQQNVRITWDAHLPSALHARQQGSTQASSLPDPVPGLEDDSIMGYFPNSTPDLAVLAISTFHPSGSPRTAPLEFKSVVRRFLATAGRAPKTRLVIDLRGNGGGYGFLAHDLFRQLFPTANPYDATNYRANRLFDLTGQTISKLYENKTPANFSGLAQPPLYFSRPWPFNYRQQLDIENKTFISWTDFFGPERVSSSNDNFTSIDRPDLENVFETGFPIYPLNESVIPKPVFEPGNIILLQDGGCASACVLFSEFMKMNAPGSGRVRSIVVGGRRQEGPMQGAGGVKGGQAVQMVEIRKAALFARKKGTVAQQLQFTSEFGEEQLVSVRSALDRAYFSPLSSTLKASVNFRNQIREGDESVTPLQYVYEAADYRFFYTAAMYGSQELVWQKAYQIAWKNGTCVLGSHGHPSAGRTTDYGSMKIPANARSSFGVTISGGGNGKRPGVIGAAPSGEQD